MRLGPWRRRRRFLPIALVPVAVYLTLWLFVGYSLGTTGCGRARPAIPLVGARAGTGGPGSAGGGEAMRAGGAATAADTTTGGDATAASGVAVGGATGPPEVLAESEAFALPPSGAANRFDIGWERRQVGGREALVAASGSARLLAVNLGEERPRVLTLDLAREGLPEGELLRVRAGDRELARTTLRAAALPLRLRLPEDLPVGQVALDLLFEPAASATREATRPGAAGSAAHEAPAPAALPPSPVLPPRPVPPPSPPLSPVSARAESTPGLPAVFGANLSPALPAGAARIEGADVVMAGNSLVYLHCRLAGQEALVGTFVPPSAARPGQRFDLSVERLDGTPIRRFGWRPSFWNRLRGARGFELPLRGTRGDVRVRLIARAADGGGGGGGGGEGRWRALGLVNVTGEILTPGQGQ